MRDFIVQRVVKVLFTVGPIMGVFCSNLMSSLYSLFGMSLHAADRL